MEAEPTIKYENCEELYTGSASGSPTAATLPPTMGEISLKRNWTGNQISNYNAVNFGMNMQTHDDDQLHQQHMSHQQQHYSNFYAAPLQQQQQQQQPPPQQQKRSADIKSTPTKRYRRGESGILFGPPFFELQQDYDVLNSGGSLTALCLSCHVVLRGHKNVSSNFIKHMKRVHPEIYKIYENIKILKYRGTKGEDKHAANSTLTATAMAAAAEENDNSYFDASTFLENITTVTASSASAAAAGGGATAASSSASTTRGDDERNSETTDNSNTPPNSTEATTENSIESQQRLPLLRPAPQSTLLQRDQRHQRHQQTNEEDEADEGEITTKVDLSHKTLNIMSKMLDEKLKAFVTLEEFHQTTQIISTLTDKNKQQQPKKAPSLQSETAPSSQSEASKRHSENEYDDDDDDDDNDADDDNDDDCKDNDKINAIAIQTQLKALQAECQSLRERMQQIGQSKQQLNRELNAMDKLLRRRKLIIRCMKLNANEKPLEAVQRLFRQQLELPNIAIENVTILSTNSNAAASAAGVSPMLTACKRHLLVELKNESDTRIIFKNCTKLKNSGIFIEPEISQYALKRKDKLLVLRKELLRRNPALKIYVRSTELSVGAKHFFWDDIEGLCVDNSWKPSGQDDCTDAAETLKTVTGLDLKEFLIVLKNYNIQLQN